MTTTAIDAANLTASELSALLITPEELTPAERAAVMAEAANRTRHAHTRATRIAAGQRAGRGTTRRTRRV